MEQTRISIPVTRRGECCLPHFDMHQKRAEWHPQCNNGPRTRIGEKFHAVAAPWLRAGFCFDQLESGLPHDPIASYLCRSASKRSAAYLSPA
jgi:hypothetical protein